MSDLLNISEASRLMGVCENTLRDWDEEGKFKAHRTIGGHRRYDLEDIREYLGKNVGECNFPKFQPEKLVIDFKQKSDKEITDLICQNVVTDNDLRAPQNNKLTYEQRLWLTREGWMKSKLRHLITVQPLSGPCGLVYYTKIKKDSLVVESDAVAAVTGKYLFQVFDVSKFDLFKDTYADAIAASLDAMIAEKLYQYHPLDPLILQDMQEKEISKLGGVYDYVIAPKSFIEKVKKFNPYIDCFEIPVMLDESTFLMMGIAGKYKSIGFSTPVMMPYILINEAPMTAGGTFSLFHRIGWYVDAKDKVEKTEKVGKNEIKLS